MSTPNALLAAILKNHEYALNVANAVKPSVGAAIQPYLDKASAQATDLLNAQIVLPPNPPSPAEAATYKPFGDTGMDVLQAATLDASVLTQKASPNPGPTSASEDAVAGCALKYGYNGVIGAGTGNSIFFGIWKAGVMVGTLMGDGTTDTSALGAQYGLNPNTDFGTISFPDA